MADPTGPAARLDRGRQCPPSHRPHARECDTAAYTLGVSDVPADVAQVEAHKDELAGTTHDGPRAFSQTHFGDTKVRDAAPAILAAAGAAPATLAALGLTRSPYLGLGGAIAVVTSNGLPLDLRTLAGPVPR